jgi:hypothetical protein
MTSNTGGFEFTHCGIGDVLKLNKLKVPPHQREYSWTSAEIEQLLIDFSDAKATGREHFLGTVVTIQDSAGGALQIVDGQQRLTTTAIFLSEIRNYLSPDESADLIVESINNDFLSIIDRKTRQRMPRLTLNTDDNDFFIDLIDKGLDHEELKPTRDSHDLLIESARTSRDWVRKLASTHSKNEVADRLNDWLEFIEQDAKVVLLKVSDGSQAFKMFETLNDRGLRTSQADLVKSYLFGQSGSRIAEAQSRWSSMRDNLQELKDGDGAINFLRHVLIATKKFARTENVYDETQTSIRGEAASVAYLADLERLSRVYVSTFQSDSSHWDTYSQKSKDAIKLYNRFDPKPVRPLLLSLALKFSQKEFERSIQLIVCLTVRATVTGKNRSGIIETTYGAAALDIYNDRVTNITELKKALEKVAVDDLEFEKAFSITRSAKPDYARYYLRALEAADKNEKEPWYVVNEDNTAVTLEHILPKNPDSGNWPQFDEDDHRRMFKRMGNLCLMQKTSNSNAGNESFEIKKTEYSISPLLLTSSLAKLNDWTPDEIESRQTKLAKLAIKAWPI